jgi:hypothetical protein
MARICELSSDQETVVKELTRALQSGHITLMLGSGASYPAIPLAGNIEAQIDTHTAAGRPDEATRLLYSLLHALQSATNDIVGPMANPVCLQTLAHYKTLLQTIERVLAARHSTILPRQATIFTTNYDVFLDVAATACESALLANGFGAPVSPDGEVDFSPRHFFRATYDTGDLYEYRVELPSLNLVKLHGCASWARDGDRILRRRVHCGLPPVEADLDAIRAFVERFAVVMPQSTKFNTTVLNRTYYDLLRLYANVLERENVLLVSFGFSFRDEHIVHLTRRALRNPTLRIVVPAYDRATMTFLADTFAAHSNVIVVVAADGESIDFTRFNALLAAAVPSHAGNTR